MKSTRLAVLFLAILLLLMPTSQALAEAPGTAFSYQGRLTLSGGVVTQICDFRFSLYDAGTDGTQVGSTLNKSAVSVNASLFTTSLDFGASAYAGDARWLAIEVRCPTGGGIYTALSPRRELTPAPYAVFASTAAWSGLTGVPAGFSDGTDADTTYTPGSGLTLTGTSFSIADGALDFIKLADSLSLDASTTIAAGTNDLVVNLDSTGDFIVQDNGTAFATFADDGNVGIGDTSPDQLLEILSSGAANTQLSIGNTNAGDLDPQIGFELADGTNTFTMGVDDSDSDKFKISTTGLGTNDRLVIDSTGKVGIGIAAPAAKLHVGAAITDFTGVPVPATTAFIDDTTLSSSFQVGHYFETTGTASGTNSGTTVMVASGDFTVATAAVLAIHAQNIASTDGDVLRLESEDSDVNFLIAENANETAVITLKYDGGALFNGNVGIGDATPDQLLEILSSSAANTQLSIGNTNAGDFDPQIGFELADGTNTFTMGVDDSDSDKFKISTTALGTSDRLVIDSSGKVGIGEAAPSALLEVAGGPTSSIPNLRVTDTNTSGNYNILQIDSSQASNGNNWGFIDLGSTEGGVRNRRFLLNGAGDLLRDGTTQNSADYAEYFYSEDATLKPGELVCIAGQNLVKRCGGGGTAIGIVSTKPGIIGIYADDVTDAAEEYANDPNWVVVGLLGQVPTKVSVANGSISAGDMLTVGSGGAAVKGESPRTLVMIALEDANSDGTIRVLIK
jgi:hypothetical protein